MWFATIIFLKLWLVGQDGMSDLGWIMMSYKYTNHQAFKIELIVVLSTPLFCKNSL